MAESLLQRAEMIAQFVIGGWKLIRATHVRNAVHSLSVLKAPKTGADTESIATEENGWIDVIGSMLPFPVGPGKPTLQTWSAPHDNFGGYAYGIGDAVEYKGHMPHGIDPAAGVYLHVHVMSDGEQTGNLVFEFEYTYAHGYSRGTFSAPQTVTITAAAAGATGSDKVHQILEIAAPILVGAIETDGILKVNCKRISNGGTDVTDNVFVEFVDAHVKQASMTSTNRNYPFENAA